VSKVTGDSQLQSEILESLSDARAYRRWLADLARPYLGPDPLEIGSGNGDYALEWVADVTTFTCTEADESRLEALKARFAGHDTVTVRHLLLGEGSRRHQRHSGAVAFNVFEHIPDDVAALRDLAGHVHPGGAVVMIVPAFPSAMSRFDRAIGHQRRYTRASLLDAIRAAGLRPERVRYVNPVGLVSWYVTVKGLGLTPKNGLMLRAYDRTVVPVARALDRVPAPFGQSVFAVARVPAGA
jgi:2-polyprenyl-3-methyl-5-hydroxy-6-metoxy-1,4-benzoquinol methylase